MKADRLIEKIVTKTGLVLETYQQVLDDPRLTGLYYYFVNGSEVDVYKYKKDANDKEELTIIGGVDTVVEGKCPFTPEEEKIMDYILKAHSEFAKLEPTHPNDITDWVQGIHALQGILGMRILRREHTEYFKTVKSVKLKNKFIG